MENASFGEPLKTIKLPHGEITLLGTAHVSKASATTVKNLIETGDYDSVAVELCENRYNSIVDPDALGRMDIFAAIRSKKIPMITANLALGAFQQRIADQIGIEPGADMRNAIFSAKEKSLPIILIDREIGTTLKRVYRNIPWYQRFKLFGALLQSVMSSQEITEDDIEKLKQGDMLESSFSEFASTDLKLYKPLINERDQFMAAKILEETQKHQYKKTLVVIGAGHMKGISEYLESLTQPEQTIQELNHIPPPASWPKFIPWILVALVLIGFTLGFMRDTQQGWELVKWWIILNGGLCAVGAIMAGAHPFTIVVSFLVAPITSLNPMVPAGLVTGALEAYLRHPHVRDFSQLRHDASTLKGWWHNRVTRIFLVFMLCNLGSGIGGWISIYLIGKSLA